MLLVSGPNAGGKSVALKTVGLIQYMLQCGLLVPMDDHSRAGLFASLFIDIGDQQSIENDLSTYSSHLKNMGVFLRHADSQSLVLMDELGSGTDPNFGGAIAESILAELVMKRVWGVATTHYYNLKLFASEATGIRNAAMRFDDQKLEPLYILDIGKPGSSFALEIARKTGLPKELITKSESLVGKELANIEALVRSLEKERNELTARVKELEKKERESQQALKQYSDLREELEGKKKVIIEKAKQEASALLRETNKEIEKTIRHIRENQAHKKETLRVRKNLESLTQKIVVEEKKPVAPEVIQLGDRVRIIGQEGSGVVMDVQGKSAVVQFGELKSTVKLDRLEKTGTVSAVDATEKKLRSVGLNVHEKRASFSSSLDVRGKRVDEVIPLLEQFMDTAILLGQAEVKILHGKGEGILRKVVRDRLKKYKDVASYADEHVERGGDGITVVVLK